MIPTLHRHALECVFAFASLWELAQLSSVCREFNAAVGSMAPSGVLVRGLQESTVPAVLLSPLARHVSELFTAPAALPLTPESMEQLNARLPNLRTLQFRAVLPVQPPLQWHQWPAQLTDLQVVVQLPDVENHEGLEYSAQHASRINALLAGLPQMVQLQRLVLLALNKRCMLPAAVSFASLAALPQLTDFCCNWPLTSEAFPLLPVVQKEQLRALISLRRLRLCAGAKAAMAQVLAPPHQWQLEDTCMNWSGDALRLLPALPTLTQLNAEVPDGDTSFLAGLPNLTSLQLIRAASPHGGMAVLLGPLRQCSKLTDLALSSDQLRSDSSALAESLRPLPLLRSLRLWLSGFDSLAFLGVLPRGLDWLNLRCTLPDGEPLPAAELQHITSLSELRTLGLACLRFDGMDNDDVIEALRAALPKVSICGVW